MLTDLLSRPGAKRATRLEHALGLLGLARVAMLSELCARRCVAAACLATALALLLAAGARAQSISGGQRVFEDTTGVSTGSFRFSDLAGTSTQVVLPEGGQLSISLTVEGGVFDPSGPGSVDVQVLVDGQPAAPGIVRFFADQGPHSNTAHFHVEGLSPGPHSVQAQWRTAVPTSAGRATSTRRAMVLRWAADQTPHIKLESKDVPFSSLRGGIPQTYQPLAGASLTLDDHGFFAARLQILVSGEFWTAANSSRVFIRALVNGVPTKNVVLAGGPGRQLASFAFVAEPTFAASHTIQLEWSSEGFAFADQTAVTVVAMNGRPTNQEGAFLQQSPASGPPITIGPSGFSPMPGVSGGRIDLPTPGNVEIRLAAETAVLAPGALQLRCKFDGVPIARVNLASFFTLQPGQSALRCREVSFVVQNAAAGPHDIELEWGATATLCGVGDRTLAVTALTGSNACPSSITLSSPASVRNLTIDPIVLRSAAALATQSVSLGDLTIFSQTRFQFSTGWFERVAPDTLHVYPPQGLAAGTRPLRIHLGTCTTNAVPITTRLPAENLLLTQSELTVPADQTIFASRGVAPAGASVVLFMSPAGTPSAAPGLVALDIGASFTQLVQLSPPLSFDPSGGVARIQLPVPASLAGARLFFQGVVLTAAPPFVATTSGSTFYR